MHFQILLTGRFFLSLILIDHALFYHWLIVSLLIFWRFAPDSNALTFVKVTDAYTCSYESSVQMKKNIRYKGNNN